MQYDFHGQFIEACDCFQLCPCWVDDEPDEGHCTGLVAWAIEGGTIDDRDVSGRCVVAVTVHGGGRRTTPGQTVVHLEPGLDRPTRDALAWAFSAGVGRRTDPLADLMRVTGDVLLVDDREQIAIEAGSEPWTVRVGGRDAAVVHATGQARRFDGGRDPLTIDHSALHRELRIERAAEAQETTGLSLAVPTLPGGYLEVRARSGMRGRFAYRGSGGAQG